MSSLNQTSAKIYQFPVGGRDGANRTALPSSEAASNPANILTCSSWYHEIAMLEEQSTKRAMTPRLAGRGHRDHQSD